MATMPANLFVAVQDEIAFIKVAGRANFAASVNFKSLVVELQDRGYRRFVLELSECVTMDSTFLGVLAGFALKLADSPAQNDSISLQLLNPSQRVTDLLDNLGIAHLFAVVQNEKLAARTYQEAPQDEGTPTRQEISETCLEAHQTLMAINPDNIPRFKDVAQFLAEDLKKMKL